MNKLVLIGLIDALVSEAISKIPPPDTIQGPQGKAGRSGRDFDFEEHKSAISEILLSNLPTPEELRGPKGDPGRDGRSFDFNESRIEIETIISEAFDKSKESLKLKFSDLSEMEVESLRGPAGIDGREGRAGRDGQDGEDFSFEKNLENIDKLVKGFISEIKESLKLKFSDLTDEEIYSLKGPKGESGRDGRNFDFDEHEERIKDLLPTREQLKLNFSDLTKEEVENLKLKFSDLTEEEIARMPRGKRGQKGAAGTPGIQGEDGKDGRDGRDGIDGKDGKDGIGKTGPMGAMGRDGRDGADAPYIEDVRIESDKTNFYLKFYFSDGSVINTNTMRVPTNNNVVVTGYAMGGGDAGGGAEETEYFFEGTTLGKFSKVNIIGNATTTPNGDTLDIEFPDFPDPPDTGVDVYLGATLIGHSTELEFDEDDFEVVDNAGRIVITSKAGSGSNPLGVSDEYIEISNQVESINFVGDYVTVKPNVPMSDWALLSDVEPSLEDYSGGNPKAITVYIDVPVPGIMKAVDLEVDAELGDLVRITESELAVRSLADSYDNAQVHGMIISINGSVGDIQIIGKTDAELFDGLDVTKDYYLSDTLPGKFTTVIPTTTNHVEIPVGKAFGTKKFVISIGQRVVK